MNGRGRGRGGGGGGEGGEGELSEILGDFPLELTRKERTSNRGEELKGKNRELGLKGRKKDSLKKESLFCAQCKSHINLAEHLPNEKFPQMLLNSWKIIQENILQKRQVTKSFGQLVIFLDHV
jgi:hypothetical protein